MMNSQKQLYISPHMRKNNTEKKMVLTPNKIYTEGKKKKPLRELFKRGPELSNNNYKSVITLKNKDDKILHVIQRYYLRQKDLFDLDDSLIPDDVKNNNRIMSKQEIKYYLKFELKENMFNNLMEYIYYKLWAKYGNIVHLVDDLKMNFGLTLPKGGNEPINKKNSKETALRELKEETGIDNIMIQPIQYKGNEKRHGITHYKYTSELTNEAHKVISDKLIYDDDDNHGLKNKISSYNGLNYKKDIQKFDNRFEVLGYVFIYTEDYKKINDNLKSDLFDKYRYRFTQDLEKEICDNFKLYLKECLDKIFEKNKIFEKKKSSSLLDMPFRSGGGIRKNKTFKNKNTKTKKNNKSNKNKKRKKTLKKRSKQSIKI